MKDVLVRVAYCLVLLLGFSGCSQKKATCNSLNGLQSLSMGGLSKTKMGALRAQSIRDTALSVGARGGLAWRACEINTILLQHESMLYRLFNFNRMMLDKNILPPILAEARNLLALGGTDTIRIADRNYVILNQAKFVTAAPTWRDYLWLSYSAPEAPDRSLLPKSREERLVWKQYTEAGWRAGIQQGDLIFKENISRLRRDFEGMIRYRSLLAQNMVSAPFVAQLDMGVTGGGSEMTVNDRVLRITAFPALQNTSTEWKPEITPDE